MLCIKGIGFVRLTYNLSMPLRTTFILSEQTSLWSCQMIMTFAMRFSLLCTSILDNGLLPLCPQHQRR